ncbi:MAG TPA: flavin reductase family protein [Anaerolineae bacterium]|nr:flavin reductase family protein [Anaerolineae bacterium]
MAKKRIKPSRPIYPSPAALITSVDEQGTPNIIALGEVFNISIRQPVIVGIAIRPATYSHGLITATREYVVNLPPSRLAAKVDACGSSSGRSGIDKFAAYGLTPLKSDEVRPPLIEECPVNLECRVIGIQTIGDHDLFLGEVVAVHVDEEVLDEAGAIVTDRLDMLIYVAGEYWDAGTRLEKHGFYRRRVAGD